MQIDITLSGAEGVPLLLHNERLANPMDEVAKAMKTISSKRSKSEDDFAELARLEFQGGVYELPNGRIGIPAWNVQRSLQDGARINRLGKAIERGLTIMSPDVVPLTHSGPDTAEKMWKAGHYDQRSVKVGTSKVTRTRPSLRDWSTTVKFHLDTEILDLDQIKLVADKAGLLCGLGDYRPRYGRFTAIVKEA